MTLLFVMVKNIVLAVLPSLLSFCAKQQINTNAKQIISVDTTKAPVESGKYASGWFTHADQSALLQNKTTVIFNGNINNSFPVIEVDSTVLFQSVDGFGFTLTEGSAYLINQMNEPAKKKLLNELFGNQDPSARISYLRISIGASDLSKSVYSYDDLPVGNTDTLLNQFSLSQDSIHLIPILQKIIALNPTIKIMATPWSPPVWMKDNANSIGGKLLTKYYDVYARYLLKYIQTMKRIGITIDAITIQNEPEHGGNNPSMLMTANEQANFIKHNLGPLFQKNNIQTKIVLYDHNCDHPEYPISILNDADARQFVDGSAFHLYNGDISALSTVYNAHKDKSLYFTEQWTGKNGTFNGDLQWHVKNVLIGSMRNHSKVALEWNLAGDAAYEYHTPGGCTECKGALTISGNAVSKNVAYYIIAHASKFVPAGSTRISSNNVGALYTVAFLTPAGKKAIIVLNNGSKLESFNIQSTNHWFKNELNPGAVATFIF